METLTKNNILWEEKNSTEPKTNFKNKETIVPNVITNITKRKSLKKEWRGIGDSKEGMRQCNCCNIFKPKTSDFFRIARRYNGKVYLTHNCRKCSSENTTIISKRYQAKYPERFWITKTVSCAQKRARENGVPFDREYVKQISKDYKHGSLCPSCKITMSYFNMDDNNHNKRKTWVSLDRIYPDKGYVKDNLCFICHRCNWLKSNATVEELENVIGYMKQMSSHA